MFSCDKLAQNVAGNWSGRTFHWRPWSGPQAVILQGHCVGVLKVFGGFFQLSGSYCLSFLTALSKRPKTDQNITLSHLSLNPVLFIIVSNHKRTSPNEISRELNCPHKDMMMISQHVRTIFWVSPNFSLTNFIYLSIFPSCFFSFSLGCWCHLFLYISKAWQLPLWRYP